MRRVGLGFALCLSGIAFAFAENGNLPSARIVSSLDKGGTEGYELSCALKASVPDCWIRSFNDDVTVESKKVDVKTSTQIVEEFFSRLPKGSVKTAAKGRQTPLKPPAGGYFFWHAALGARYAEGAVTRKQRDNSTPSSELGAVTGLEGRLIREVER